MPQTKLSSFYETAVENTKRRGKAHTLQQLRHHIERGMATSGYSFKMSNGLNAKIYALNNPKMAKVKKAVEPAFRQRIGFGNECVIAVPVHRKMIYLVCNGHARYQTVLPEMWHSPLPTFDSVCMVVFRNVAYPRRPKQRISIFFKAILEKLDPDIIALMTKQEEKPWPEGNV
jgi:hypothetical protein